MQKFLGIVREGGRTEAECDNNDAFHDNRDVITRQQAQSKRLAEHADSLAARNVEQNHQLQGLVPSLNGRTIFVPSSLRIGAKVLETLTDTEKVSGEVVIEKEVLDFAFDGGGGDAGIKPQTGTVADLGVETLAGYQSCIFLNERENVERHLIVTSPRNIREPVIDNSRHNVNVILENGSGVDRKRNTSLKAGQVSTELN